MPEWVPVGEIVRLQTQNGEMTGNGGYDLSLLVEVPELRVTADGAFGRSGDAWLVDRHHRRHPSARHWHAEETISFGFTSHYEHMWATFRTTALGSAGENVIVASPKMWTIAEVGGGVRIETTTGMVDFTSPAIAEPCVEFSRFMTNLPDADARAIKPHREKLKHGVRGFVAGYRADTPANVSTGDVVYAKASR